ncbi:MAG: putative alpha/beta hydrolase [Myxococcota bacterium]|jgi:predicted alpha/beta hydrolase
MSSVHPVVLTATDGRSLSATLFEPSGPVIANVVMLGAWAVQQRFYRRFATWLCERGFRILTFDVRGIGESLQGHVRNELATTSDWALLDHGAALRWLAEQPGTRLAVGHSFGGQVPGITDHARCVDGLYTVGSQLGYWGHFEGLNRYWMRMVFTFIMPATVKTFGYLPRWAGIGEDVPPNALLEWATWLRSPGYLLDHVAGADERFARWPGKIRMVGFTDDDYAPPKAVRLLSSCYDPDRLTVQVRTPAEVGQDAVGHFGFFRAMGEALLWEECADQLGEWAHEVGSESPD